MSELPAISLRDVSFAYEGAPVLEHASFDVRAKELVSVVGPNGGGKTTLLRLILGLLHPQLGKVRVLGEHPARVRRRIGYCPQHSMHDPQFPVTVNDVVLMGRAERRWAGPYGRRDRQAASAALDEVGMGEYASRPFSALSGGQRQRVLIARALSCEPEILLLDEPTANVDLVAENQLHDVLHRLTHQMTILLVSHDLGFVSQVVESVICVNRRVVVHPTSEITGEMIQDIYGGEVRIVRHDHRCAEDGHAVGEVMPHV